MAPKPVTLSVPLAFHSGAVEVMVGDRVTIPLVFGYELKFSIGVIARALRMVEDVEVIHPELESHLCPHRELR